MYNSPENAPTPKPTKPPRARALYLATRQQRTLTIEYTHAYIPTYTGTTLTVELPESEPLRHALNAAFAQHIPHYTANTYEYNPDTQTGTLYAYTRSQLGYRGMRAPIATFTITKD